MLSEKEKTTKGDMTKIKIKSPNVFITYFSEQMQIYLLTKPPKLNNLLKDNINKYIEKQQKSQNMIVTQE